MRVTLATVAAFVIAGLVLPGPEPPVVAALTALLVVQVTPYRTIKTGWQRVGSVVAGVLVAVLLSEAVGLTWWSLAITVLAALVIGTLLRLGAQAVEVPISAMLVLAVGSHTEVGVARVYETLIGAAVGIGVSLLTPRTYAQDAADAIAALAQRIAGLLRSLAGEIEQAWTYERAVQWLQRARELEHTVQTARAALATAEESMRINPRGRHAAHVPRTQRSGLTALEYAAINVRVVCRALVDRVEGVPERELPGRRVARPLARLFAACADAVAAFGEVVTTDVAGPTRNDEALRRSLQTARARWQAAGSALMVDARRDPLSWREHGALLAHTDRLLDEIDPGAETAATAIDRARAGSVGLPARSATMLRRAIRRVRQVRPPRRLTHR